MSAGDLGSDSELETESPFAPVVDVDPTATLRVDCYVRASVPPAITGTVDGIVRRLRELDDRDLIDDHRVARWPPECRSVASATDGDGDATASTRDELVATFERWAARNGHSLEPAFRRREIPPSPLDVEPDEPRERVRVPLVALAFYEGDASSGDDAVPTPTNASLRGVVPYTERPGPDRSRTYTVDDALSAVEALEEASRPGTRGSDGPTPVEGQR